MQVNPRGIARGDRREATLAPVSTTTCPGLLIPLGECRFRFAGDNGDIGDGAVTCGSPGRTDHHPDATDSERTAVGTDRRTVA
jgi:hypothetical protein